MKLSQKQVQMLVREVFKQWEQKGLSTFKVDRQKIESRAIEIVQQNMDQEKQLDIEVNKMLDDLEKSHQGEFQRYKMFPLIKQKLAKEKGFVL